MKKEYTSSAAWNSASLAGLVLATVTIACELISSLCGKVSGVGGGFLGFLAWALKIVACALVFKYFMQRFFATYEDIDRQRLKNYGLRLALFSSLLVAAYSLVNILVINPDTIDQIMEGYRQGYASMMDSNAEAALEKMRPQMPLYIGIVTLVYCFIWGWIYSSVFSRGTISDDPFAQDEQMIDNQ